MSQTIGDVELLNKAIREKIAICEAFGLSYWADHPLPGRMWAVDNSQQPHVIRWYRSKGWASKQYAGFNRRNELQSYDIGERIAVAV